MAGCLAGAIGLILTTTSWMAIKSIRQFQPAAQPRSFCAGRCQLRIGGTPVSGVRRPELVISLPRNQPNTGLRFCEERRPQQALNHEYVSPGSVELAMAAMQTDGSEAASLDEVDAGEVVGKELANQLMEAVLFGRRCKCISKRRADSPASRLGVYVDTALANPGIARTTAVGRETGPTDDVVLELGHEQRESPVANALPKVGRRSQLGLERRPPFGDRHVVDRAYRLSIARRRTFNCDLFCTGHSCNLMQIRPQAMAPGPKMPQELCPARECLCLGEESSRPICRARPLVGTFRVVEQLAGGEDLDARLRKWVRLLGRWEAKPRHRGANAPCPGTPTKPGNA